jgi:hypothetical protein
MLKKALAVATLAAAATGGASFMAPAASASDTSGGNYSQNVNVLPHLCIDAKRVGEGLGLVAGVPVEALTETKGQQCNEKTIYKSADKSALSDFADLGAYQH